MDLLLFFILVFLFQVPFLAAQQLYQIELLSGLPLSALTFFTPSLAAGVIVYRNNGTKALGSFLRRSLDFGKIKNKLLYFPLLAFYPAIVMLCYALVRLDNANIPELQIDPINAISLCFIFLLAGILEELGWTGYATDLLQPKFGQFHAGMMLGSIWALWHWLPLLQAHHSLEWIMWWTIYTIAARIIMIWLYNKTNHSVFAVSVFHMTLNVAWQLYPVNGSYFDVKMVGILLLGIVVLINTNMNINETGI